MNAPVTIKPADRINSALAGNTQIDAIIDALGVLKDTRIFCARWNNHYRELVEEYALLGMMEGIIGGDHSEAREAIRDELRSEFSYCIVEDKRIRPDGELAA